MSGIRKGLLVGLIHLLLVCSLGAKLLYDRATRPRIWVRSVSFDPALPIRGRYVALRARPAFIEWSKSESAGGHPRFVTGAARLEVRDGSLVAIPDEENGSVHISDWGSPPGSDWGTRTGVVDVIAEPSLFFIPEGAIDPTRLKPGETLWFEATIPKKGPPRPIRLAISKADGTFTPLDLR